MTTKVESAKWSTSKTVGRKGPLRIRVLSNRRKNQKPILTSWKPCTPTLSRARLLRTISTQLGAPLLLSNNLRLWRRYLIVSTSGTCQKRSSTNESASPLPNKTLWKTTSNECSPKKTPTMKMMMSCSIYIWIGFSTSPTQNSSPKNMPNSSIS